MIKKSDLRYIIYSLLIIGLFAYLSVMIINGKFNEIIDNFLPKNPKIEMGPKLVTNFTYKECKPCKNIGNEPPNCSDIPMIKSKNPQLRGELKPLSKAIYDGNIICLNAVEIEINSYGFRDREYTIQKPKDTVRIIVFGDSMFFGLNIQLNETVAKVLEKMLNDKSVKRYEVLNLAVPGFNMLEKIEFFKEKGTMFNPDMVILEYETGDMLDWKETEKIKENLHKNYPELSDIQLTIKANEEQMKKLERMSFNERWKTVKESLIELAKITKEKNIKVIFTAYIGTLDDEIAIKEFARQNDWIFVPLYGDTYSGYAPSDLILHPKDPHPSALAHKIIAEAIYKKIKDWQGN
jgi:hypothetical protein